MEEATGQDVGKNETGCDDIFESVLNLESTIIEKGRTAASLDKKSVDGDSYSTGKRYGEEIGYELGFILGVISELQERLTIKQYNSSQTRQERAMRTIRTLKEKIRSLPLETPDEPTFTERLDEIRISYKKARALLGIWQKGEQNSAGSLEF